MSIRHHLKLGRDWHVKAGFTDNHPLTKIYTIARSAAPPAGCVSASTRPPSPWPTR